MDELIILYFGSVAEGVIFLAVAVLAVVALTNGYSVVKKKEQRRNVFSRQSPIWNSIATWLLIVNAIVLAAHLLTALVSPDWLTLGVTGAIAVIQILLNCIIARELESAYLLLHHE